MNDAFVLGAGFSKAIGLPMPDTADLGIRVINQQKSIHRSETTTHSGRCDDLSCDTPVLPANWAAMDFERWLSKLAESQPYLYEPENLQRSALFQKISQLIALQIDGAVHQTVAGQQPPTWLVDMVTCWHTHETRVLTFNYDTLIEATIDGLKLVIPGLPLGLSHDLLGPIPLERTYGGWRVEPAKTMSLIKLHGSTHWYWDEATRSTDSIESVGLQSHWGRAEREYVDGRQRAPGKVPLIVPPVFGKSSFFSNSFLRELWHSAYLALGGATRLFFVGYSLPVADLLVQALLEEGVQRGTEIWVVNPDKNGDVRARFETVFDNVRLEFCGKRGHMGDDFAAWYLQEAR